MSKTLSPPQAHRETRKSRDTTRDGLERDESLQAPLPRKEPTMLVLSRQKDETIIIGDNIEITVVDIRGDKVRLGVSAHKEISVHHKEVYEAIRRENRVDAQVTPDDFTVPPMVQHTLCKHP